MKRRRGFAWAITGVVIVLAVVAAIWGSDRVTWQGERTIFTVTCLNGVWEGSHCTGKLGPGPRYAFRASPTRSEVLYWVRYSEEASGKYANCQVKDRDNWTCKAEPGQKPSIASELKNGRPTRGSAELMLQFHSVPKWKWWAIDTGLASFNDADSY